MMKALTTIAPPQRLAGLALAAVAALALTVAGCSSGDTTHAAQAEGSSPALALTGPEAAESAGHSLEDAHHGTPADDGAEPPLVNTSSVLFPKHQMTRDAYNSKRLLYLDNLETFSPKFLPVTEPTALRAGPGKDYETIDIFIPGDTVRVDGTVGSWYRMADGSGYINGFTLSDADHPLPSDVVWAATVTNEGGSAEVDACSSGLTRFTAIEKDLGIPYYAMHSICGGDLILELEVGEHIMIDDATYTVAWIDNYELFGSTELLDGITADAIVHTCDLAHGKARLVGLTARGTR
ncbi:MAG: SH3 domain-containing protein [Cellulomonadaceae bacterium]|jgi:hypothetical protein|nr:SH3 domain-containing protein [Cellulomonadaceae bacterium]